MKNNIVNIENINFIKFKDDNINLYFSTADNDVSFKVGSKMFKKNIDTLKENLNLEDIIYLNQVHSDIVLEYNDISYEFNSGDAIIMDEKNIGIGIFTADCVPILMYNKKLNLISAIHSGWRGTYNEIAVKTLEKFIKKGSNVEDIKVFIGPHICKDCYEVSEELIEKFNEKGIFKDRKINKNRYLSLEECVKVQLLEKGILESNIESLNLCTYCSTDFKLHSFRKEKEESGRLFSFIFIN